MPTIQFIVIDDRSLWGDIAYFRTSLVFACTSLRIVLRSMPGPDAGLRWVLLFTSFSLTEDDDTDILSFSLLPFLRSVSEVAFKLCLLFSVSIKKWKSISAKYYDI